MLPERPRAQVFRRGHHHLRSVIAMAIGAFLPLAGFAQKLPTWDRIAERTSADREIAIMESNHLVSEGDRLLREGDLGKAVAAYRNALQRLPNSPRTQGFRKALLSRYSQNGAEYAEQLIADGDSDRARRVLEDLLSRDMVPSDPRSRKLLKRLDDPIYANPENTASHQRKVGKVEQLLQEGYDFISIGKFDMATVRFSEVLGLDRYNAAARQGLSAAAKALDEYRRAARDQARASALREVDEKWDLETEAREGSIAGISGEDGLQVGASNSSNISRKLASIIIPEIRFANASIQEALDYLRMKSVELDSSNSAQPGVNFIVSNPESFSGGVTIAVKNMPLGEILKYVVQQFNARYRIDQYAVQVVSSSDQGETMISRRYRVPPDFFNSAPGGGDGVSDDPFGDAGASDDSLVIRRRSPQEFLEESGIPFPEGASAQFITSNSTLIVTNSVNNLDLVQQFVDSASGNAPKLVRIETRIMEITEDRLNEIGFDWLANRLDVNDRFLLGGGTPVPEAFDGIFRNDAGGFVGENQVTGGLRSTDGLLRNGLDSIIGTDRASGSQVSPPPSPGVFGVTRMLNRHQFQMVLRALNQRKGSDLYQAPSVVTKSGQSAKTEAIRELLYPTEYDPPELPQTAAAGDSGGFPVTPANPTAFEMRPVGMTLEVDPQIGSDNYTVDLNLAPEFVRFLGFVNYGSPITTSIPNPNPVGPPTLEQVLTENRINMPVFSTIRATSNITVWDGQTVALAGFDESRIEHIQDKVPLLGDVPYLGKLFRSDVEREKVKVVVIFVTVNIIDPAGRPFNRPNSSNALVQE